MKRALTLALAILSMAAVAQAIESAENSLQAAPQYDLKIKLTPEAHLMEVTGTLRLPAVKVSRRTVVLSLVDEMHDFKVEVAEPAAIAGLARLEKMGDSKWLVHPLKSIPSGARVLLRFSYSGGE